MKKIVLFLAVVLSLCMSACAEGEGASVLFEESEKPFVEVESGYFFGKVNVYYVFADKETKVMYLFIDGDGDALTMLVNPDGTPRLYDGELED